MTALITGASSGIGESLARELARRGYDVVLVARSGEKLRTLGEQLGRQHGVRAHVIVLDLVAAGAAATLVERAHAAAGRIDLLVNNAGFATYGRFAETSLADELDEMRLNVEVLTELTKRLLPDLLAGRGKVLNVASTAAFQPGPLMAVYYATKAYVLSFSEALAEELAPTGVTVTCLCPGSTRTGFQARAKLEDSRLLMIGLLSADAVARRAVDGLLKGRRIVIPGLQHWLGAQLPRVLPRSLTTKIVRWLQDRRHGHA
jgi:short-subunit dehydrogenase